MENGNTVHSAFKIRFCCDTKYPQNLKLPSRVAARTLAAMLLLRRLFLVMLILLPLRPLFAGTLDACAVGANQMQMSASAQHMQSTETHCSDAQQGAPHGWSCNQHCAVPLSQPPSLMPTSRRAQTWPTRNPARLGSLSQAPLLPPPILT